MSFYILASLIILGIFVASTVQRRKKEMENAEKEFWNREYRANNVRKKSLDNLKYITIPIQTFPTNVLNDNPVILECIETLSELTTSKIVNLTGMTNTDLKLEFGTANITALSEYDENYTSMVVTLQKWADELLKEGRYDEASILMEFSVSTGCDITRTYLKLAEYYSLNLRDEEIEKLIGLAASLNSSNKNTIMRKLQNKDYN